MYLARDRLLDEDVAVKVVHANLARNAKFRARFLREVANSARVAHPHVVPVLDTGALATGEPWVALGLARGGSLEDLLDRPLPLDLVAPLLDQVLDALATIHAQGLLHQDLKPGNVLLAQPIAGALHAWVADLGIAEGFATVARDRRTLAGSPPWMAPEQLLGRVHELGPWTDLYAVGLMAWRMLVGSDPWAPMERTRMASERMRGLPAWPAEVDVPTGVVAWMQALLDPEPRSRFDRAADARRALADALSDAPTAHWAGASAVAGVPRWRRPRVPALPLTPPPPYPGPAPLSPALVGTRRGTLVGRAREVSELWELAREVHDDARSRVICIIGPSGAGRTHLVEDFTRSLDAGGWMEILHLRYRTPAGVEDGYRGAVRTLLRPWNDTRDGMESRVARWLARDRGCAPLQAQDEAAQLARWCGFVREGEATVRDDVALRYARAHLRARSWRGGVCVVLEDAHGATTRGDGLAFAQAVLERALGDTPVLVLCTLSAEAIAADTSLARRIDALVELGAQRMDLARMDLGATRSLVAGTLVLQDTLAEAIATTFSGQPLAVELLLRDWSGRGLLQGTPGAGFALQDVTLGEALPGNVAALAQRRLQAAIRLAPDPEAAGVAMALAAFAGSEAPVAMLRDMVEGGIDVLLASGVLVQSRSALDFEHPDVAAEATRIARARPDARALQLRLAEAWETYGKTTGTDVARPVGEHRLRGGDPAGSLPSLLRAARALSSAGRSHEAIRTAALAVEAAEALGQGGARAEARRLHAEALLEAGEPARALPLLAFAVEQGEVDRLGRARLRLLRARAARKALDLATAHRELEAARETFSIMVDRAGLVDVASERARLLRAEGRHADAIGAWAEVLRLQKQNPSLEAEAFNGMVEAMIRAGRAPQAAALERRMRDLADASNDPRRQVEALSIRGLLLLAQDEAPRAAALFQHAVATSTHIAADGIQLRVRGLLSAAARLAGAPQAARASAGWLLRAASLRGLAAWTQVARLELALAAFDLGDADTARRECDLATRELPDASPLWLYIGALRAALAAQNGDEAGASARWGPLRGRLSNEASTPVDVRHLLERVRIEARARGWAALEADVDTILRPPPGAFSVPVLVLG